MILMLVNMMNITSLYDLDFNLLILKSIELFLIARFMNVPAHRSTMPKLNMIPHPVTLN